MKKLILLFLLLSWNTTFGATEFISSINTTGEDYNTLTLWESAMDDAGNITDGTVKCGDWDNQTGSDISDATAITWDGGSSSGTLIHMTATQYMIDVSSGTLSDNDTVDDGGGNTFDVNGTPDSCIIVAEVYEDQGDLITTNFDIDGLTTSSTNYMEIRAKNKHIGIPNTGAKLLNNSSTGDVIDIMDDYVRIVDIDIEGATNSATNGFTCIDVSGDGVIVSNVLAKQTNAGSGNGIAIIVRLGFQDFTIVNSLLYDNKTIGILYLFSGSYNNYAYNLTVEGTVDEYGFNARQFTGSYGTIVARNVLSTNNNLGDFRITSAGTIADIQYSSSGDGTADNYGGTGNIVNQTFSFVDSANDNYLLTNYDTGARNQGFDLSNDSNYSFGNDVNGTNRPQGGLWDIGFDEVLKRVIIID